MREIIKFPEFKVNVDKIFFFKFDKFFDKLKHGKKKNKLKLATDKN